MVHTGNYLAIKKRMKKKKNEILSFVVTWMDVEGIVLSGISRVEKEIVSDIIYMWSLKNTTNQ